MKHYDPESTDLAELTRRLRNTLGEAVPGAVVGKTRIRDRVAEALGCSMLQAEQLVDTMVGRGFLVKETGDDGLEYWSIRSE